MKMLIRAAMLLLVVGAWPALAQTAESARAPAGFAPLQAPCVVQANGSCTAVAVDAPLPARAPVLSPATWVTGSTSRDLRSYGGATLQVSGLSGGDTVTVSWSLDGTNYVTASYVGADFSTGSSIAADGIYSFTAGGYLKWSKTGSASTPVVTLRAGG